MEQLLQASARDPEYVPATQLLQFTVFPAENLPVSQPVHKVAPRLLSVWKPDPLQH